MSRLFGCDAIVGVLLSECDWKSFSAPAKACEWSSMASPMIFVILRYRSAGL